MKKLHLAIFLSIFLFPHPSPADDFTLIPSIVVRDEYNDAIYGSGKDKEGDFIATVSPGIALMEKTDRLDLNLGATVSPGFYLDHEDFNDVDQNYSGKMGYRIDELTGVTGRALFDVSNRPDRDIETTGLVESNSRRERMDYGLGISRKMTELSDVSLSGGYSRENWDAKNSGEDLESHTVALNFTRNLSSLVDSTVGRLNLGYGRYRYETSDTLFYYMTLGARHRFTESVSLLVDLGGNSVDADFLTRRLVYVEPFFEIQTVSENSRSVGGVGSAALEFQGELTAFTIALSHDIRTAGSRSSTVKRSDATLNLRRRLAERSAASVACGYIVNRADKGEYSGSEIDEDTFFIRPFLQWEFSEYTILEAGYYFSYTNDRAGDGSEDGNRNRVYLQLTYGLPLFE
jgi:hypothetical protein